MQRCLLSLVLAACAPAEDATKEEAGESPNGQSDDTSADSDPGEDADTDVPVGGTPQLGTPVPITAAGGNAGADLAIDEDGRLFAVWAHGGAVMLSTSEDGGTDWSAPVAVHEGALEVAAYDVSHPQVVVGAGRIVVSLAPRQHQYLYVGDAATLTFSDGVFIGAPDLKFEDLFLRSAIAPDGEVWTSFHAFPAGNGWSDGWKGVARESTGWALERASDAAPGLPCECCPQDLAFSTDGVPLLGYRNNDDDIRDMFVASGAGFATSTQVGQTDWAITYCPVQGPRLDRLPGGDILMAWSDASLGDASVLVAASEDGGESWSPPVTALVEAGEDHKSPTIAAGGPGEAWLTTCTRHDGEGGVAHSADAGRSWSSRAPLLVEGGPLLFPEVAANASQAGVVGVDGSGRVWYLPVQAPAD